MERGATGQTKQMGSGNAAFEAFVPYPLPPHPPLQIESLFSAAERANQALGRLDGISQILPDPHLFIYLYIRKEALLSSQIEGTQSSFSELLLFEEDSLQSDRPLDVQEVSNYIRAMNFGLERIQSGFPLSLRLLREIHEKLLEGSRGSDQSPGEIRRSQNWIGGTRPGNAIYVPPPVEEMNTCLGEFEKFIHSDSPPLPTLIRAGLLHAQFESIHPFLDGNGRLGRLLITLFLCERGVLRQPMLYLSLFLKNNRQQYYELLQQVRLRGVWEEWIEFFLEGVAATADQAIETARRALELFEQDRKSISTLGRAAPTATLVHDLLKQKITVSVSAASEHLKVSDPTARSALNSLEKLGIVKEVSGKQRGKLYSYLNYLNLLSEGTEPLPLNSL